MHFGEIDGLGSIMHIRLKTNLQEMQDVDYISIEVH